MTAREYFKQIQYLDCAIDSKYETLGRLKALARKATATLSDMPGGGNGGKSTESIIVKIIDLQNEINADIDILVDMKAAAIKLIRRLPALDERLILEKKYVQGKDWPDICTEMKCSDRQVFRKSQAALRQMDIFLKNVSNWQ